LNRRRQPFRTGLRWLSKYFKDRQRHTYLGLESWAGTRPLQSKSTNGKLQPESVPLCLLEIENHRVPPTVDDRRILPRLAADQSRKPGSSRHDEIQLMSASAYFLSTGVKTPGTMSPNSRCSEVQLPQSRLRPGVVSCLPVQRKSSQHPPTRIPLTIAGAASLFRRNLNW
jgi:hypothetical protein